MSKGKFITSKEAAERLGFTPDWVRKLCVDGKIKGEKLGNTWVTTLDAIRKIKRQRHSKEQKSGIRSEK